VNTEAIVQDLVATFPEAYAGIDPQREFGPDPPDDHWLTYVALPYVRRWVEERALALDQSAETTRVVDPEALRRYLAWIERYADGADRDLRNLLQIECFEGTPWVEDVLDLCGPHTLALLRDAQVTLAGTNGRIGRWRDPSRPGRSPEAEAKRARKPRWGPAEWKHRRT
jgi:hypothetical protein